MPRPNEPMHAATATRLIRHAIKQGAEFFYTTHAKQRQDLREMDEVDCENVLLAGAVKSQYNEFDPEKGWSYRVVTNKGYWVAVRLFGVQEGDDDDDNGVPAVLHIITCGRPK